MDTIITNLSYVHLQNSTTVEETIEAKRAFEAYARQYELVILHYHADNGRFADKQFIKHIDNEQQTISFCAANAHFQNGKAEKRIRDLQEQARTMLMHSMNKWPHASSIHLWPYALYHGNDIRNHLPLKSNKSPFEIFTSSSVQPKLKNFHTFGCPVFTL